MVTEWWYSTGKNREGPVLPEDLRKLMVEGTVSSSTLVWRQGMDEWAPMGEVPDLHLLMESLPPDLPRSGEVIQPGTVVVAGPWRRFVARHIDLWVIGWPTGFVVAYVLSPHWEGLARWIEEPGTDYLFGWLLLPLVLALEIMIFTLSGTTFGKALLGIKIMTVDGAPLTPGQYAVRQLGVYWYGLFTGLPLVNLFTMAAQHHRLKKGAAASYDAGHFSVSARKLSIARKITAAIVLVLLLFLRMNIELLGRIAEPRSPVQDYLFEYRDAHGGKVAEEWESLNDTALRLFSSGETDEAAAIAEEAVRLAQGNGNDVAIAVSMATLATIRKGQGDYLRAEELYNGALAILERNVDAEDPAVTTILNNLALIYADRGEYARAEQLCSRALTILESTAGAEDVSVANTLNNLGMICRGKGDYERAEVLYSRALGILEKALGPEDPAVATTLNNMAVLCVIRGEYAAAESLYGRALRIRESTLGSEDPAVATTLHNLAVLHALRGEYTEAEPLLKRALAIWERYLGADHPDVATGLESLAGLYRETGRELAAEEYERRAAAIRAVQR